MKRKIYKNLLEWKNNKERKPLIISGQRQIGKTYVVKEFVKKEFNDFLYINFLDEPNIKKIFEDSFKPNDVYRKLSLYKDHKIKKETLIIFDEFQEFIEVIQFFKTLNESSWPNNLIATGSWVDPVLYKNKISYPIGQVERIEMHPFTIEEFIYNLSSKEILEEIKISFNNKKPLPELIHKKLMSIYNDYLYIGGLPEIVSKFNDYKNKKTSEEEMQEFVQNKLTDLNNGYLADLAKYGNPINMVKMMSLYDSLPNNLNRPYNKFKYSLIKEGSQKRSWDRYTDLITLSRVAIKAYKIGKPSIPLNGYYDPDHFKLYYSDVGLLTNKNKITMKNILEESSNYFGWITENFAAIHLNTFNEKLFYWYKEPYELDFLLNIKGSIIPIDIKSGRKRRSSSLKFYQEKYHPKHSIIISKNNFVFNKEYTNIPLYAIFLLENFNL